MSAVFATPADLSATITTDADPDNVHRTNRGPRRAPLRQERAATYRFSPAAQARLRRDLADVAAWLEDGHLPGDDNRAARDAVAAAVVRFAVDAVKARPGLDWRLRFDGDLHLPLFAELRQAAEAKWPRQIPTSEQAKAAAFAAAELSDADVQRAHALVVANSAAAVAATERAGVEFREAWPLVLDGGDLALYRRWETANDAAWAALHDFSEQQRREDTLFGRIRDQAVGIAADWVLTVAEAAGGPDDAFATSLGDGERLIAANGPAEFEFILAARLRDAHVRAGALAATL